MCAAQFKIERRCINDNFIIVEIGTTVRVIIVITNNKTDLLVRLVIVHGRHRAVNTFGDRGDLLPCPFRSIMEVNEEMFRFDRPPIQFRMIIILLADCDRKG